VGSITIKSGANAGNQLAKREIVLVDQTMKTVKMTLWDEHIHAVKDGDDTCPVIAIRSAKVGDFGGRSVSTTRSSMVSRLLYVCVV
jgi:replication factor A1